MCTGTVKAEDGGGPPGKRARTQEANGHTSGKISLSIKTQELFSARASD